VRALFRDIPPSNLTQMERAAATDKRLDDLASATRDGFARVDQDIRDLRAEMGQLRGELHDEMREGFAAQRAEFDALHQMTIRIGGGTLLGFITVLAAIIARGA
jgi:hypothetical protein